MNKDRLRTMAKFLGTLSLHEKTKEPMPGQYLYKMKHLQWQFACVRVGSCASELGELPTIFPEHWSEIGSRKVYCIDTPNISFWNAIEEFFDISYEESGQLFMWDDGNKKKCAKNNKLPQNATRTDVAKHITLFIGEDPSIY
jgi:hypothetical protein